VRADDVGLFVEGEFTSDEIGQALRQKALADAVIGLSVGGPVIAARTLPGEGRELVKVDLAHVALTLSPAHPGAAIMAAKTAAVAAGRVALWTVLSAEQELALGSALRDPDRERRRREDEMLAAADWPPRYFDRETRLLLLNGLAKAQAVQAFDADDDRRRELARRERLNAESDAMRAAMASHRDPDGRGHCPVSTATYSWYFSLGDNRRCAFPDTTVGSDTINSLQTHQARRPVAGSFRPGLAH
jgi:hypothetical protein